MGGGKEATQTTKTVNPARRYITKILRTAGPQLTDWIAAGPQGLPVNPYRVPLTMTPYEIPLVNKAQTLLEQGGFTPADILAGQTLKDLAGRAQDIAILPDLATTIQQASSGDINDIVRTITGAVKPQAFSKSTLYPASQLTPISDLLQSKMDYELAKNQAERAVTGRGLAADLIQQWNKIAGPAAQLSNIAGLYPAAVLPRMLEQTNIQQMYENSLAPIKAYYDLLRSGMGFMGVGPSSTTATTTTSQPSSPMDWLGLGMSGANLALSILPFL